MNTNTTTISRMPVHTAHLSIDASTDAIREERYALRNMAQRAIRSALEVCVYTRKARAWRYAMTDAAIATLRAEVEEVWRPVLCDHVARQACHDILENVSIFILRCELRSTAAEEQHTLTAWRASVTLVLVADGDVIAKLALSQDWTV